MRPLLLSTLQPLWPLVHYDQRACEASLVMHMQGTWTKDGTCITIIGRCKRRDITVWQHCLVVSISQASYFFIATDNNIKMCVGIGCRVTHIIVSINGTTDSQRMPYLVIFGFVGAAERVVFKWQQTAKHDVNTIIISYPTWQVNELFLF